MARVKVGVVGVGALGRHHTRLYSMLDDAELVGVFDSNTEQATAIAAEFGCQAFASQEELATAVDAVSVAVPTDLHRDVVSQLLATPLHVLVEKPLADTVDAGRALVDLAAKHGVILAVGHVERYNPVITYLESKIREPRFIESHRLAPYPPPRPGLQPRGTEVGVVLDLMIHDIDIILHLVNSPVKSVDAVGIPVLSASEDIANARIRFDNGCVANLTASRISPERMRKIRVFQSDTYLSLDYQEMNGEIVTRIGSDIQREPVPIVGQNALQQELTDFVRCIANDDGSGLGAPRVTGAHGLMALEIADEITQQIAIEHA